MPKRTKDNKVKDKTRKKNNKRNKEEIKKETNDNKFNFDEEIVIGLRRIDDEPQVNEKQNKNKRKNKPKSSKSNQKNNKQKNNQKNVSIDEEPQILIKSKYMSNYEEQQEKEYIEKNNKKDIKKNKKKKKKKEQNSNKRNKKNKPLTKKQELSRKRRKIVFKIIRWLTLIAIIIGGIIYALLSPIFNIKEITVLGNSKISTETIISLSGLNIDQNIFKYRTSDVENNIKQNAYIDRVEISRQLPDNVEIVVYEREATYKLSFGNAYAYINNQGYILEITSVKGEYPLITGYSTPQEDIVAGNRLCTEDLEKLEDVLRIMEAASSVDENLRKKITGIDISDKNNYILDIDSEKKQVYLGDVSNLSTKMLWINEFIEREEGIEGTIIINVDLNNDMPYFNEKV